MNKRLVAYFSASGVTAKVAENLADAIGADIFEIQPEVPYTKADLNWMDKKARTTIEMSDPTSRPAIAAKRDNIDEYDTIFVGFPIWWYVAPTIVNTFLESYNLKGKTIIPFATSGGSGMGKTNEKLAPSCPGAKLLHGKVFNSYSSKADFHSKSFLPALPLRAQFPAQRSWWILPLWIVQFALVPLKFVYHTPAFSACKYPVRAFLLHIPHTSASSPLSDF